MRQSVKNVLKKMPFFSVLHKMVLKRRQQKEVVEWERSGRPAPPPHLVKQRALLQYANTYGLKVLVETGTYKGAMVEAMKRHFDRVYSIELSQELHAQAVKKFSRDSNVELIQGDSGTELGRLITRIKQPTLFWLDGHYSAGVTAKGEKETPIFEEMEHLLGAPDLGHVCVIDDARCFGTDPAYPTLEAFYAFVKARRKNVEFLVQDDSIRITPKK